MIWQTNKRYVLFVCNQQKIYQKSDCSSHCMVEHHALHITGHLDALSSQSLDWSITPSLLNQSLGPTQFSADRGISSRAAEYALCCGIFTFLSMISTIVGVMDDDISHQSLISVDSSHESRVSFHF